MTLSLTTKRQKRREKDTAKALRKEAAMRARFTSKRWATPAQAERYAQVFKQTGKPQSELIGLFGPDGVSIRYGSRADDSLQHLGRTAGNGLQSAVA